MNILLVEDNEADARLFAELLSELPGAPKNLTATATLADALAKIGGHDVVFLDLSLPDAHGMQTLTRMVQAARNVPIVVLTGNEDERVALEAMKAGAQDYLVKGEITPSLIARTARYAIERKAAEENARRLAKSDEAAERARFISSLTSAISSSFDLTETLPRIAKLLLPTLGDFAMIDLVRDGRIDRVAHATTYPEHEAAIREIATYTPNANPRSAVHEVIERREPLLRNNLDWEELTGIPRLGELATEMGLCGLLVLPLVARGRVVGALSLVMGPSRRAYDDDLRRLGEDVAERLALGIDNATLYAEVQCAVRGRDELLAVVSHDLRNPLNIVALALQMMEGDPAAAANALPRAKRAADRMLRLIEDLLDVARIDAGTLSVEPTRVDIAALLDEMYEQNRVLAADRRILLVRDYDRHVGYALADRHRLGQALSNLLGNALKFTPVAGTIRIGAELRGERVAIWVADTGPGIPPEHLGHIFDRFWQPTQRRDGVGLGLAIVKGIIDAHGGSIDVESTPGIGTTFRILLKRPEARVTSEMPQLDAAAP
jgi:signal transduction histidine kinase/FixJ family two-component response regulator